MKKIIFIAALISTFPYGSLAEEIELAQISIKKGQKEIIESIPAFSLEEILDYSSSIDLKKRSAFGIQQDVSLRGSIFEDTSISLQGIPLNDPQTGHFSLEIPLTSADLKQVDIFKNAQKIDFVTKPPQDEGLLIKAGFGEHALREQLLSWNFPMAQAKNRVSCEHRISKGDRQDTDFEVYNFSFHSLWEGQDKENKLEFLCGHTRRDFGADSFYSSSYPHEEEHVAQSFYSLLSELKGELLSLNNTLYLRRHSDKYILDRHNPSFYTNYHTTYVYGLKSRIDFNKGLFLNLNIDRENVNSTNLQEHQRLKKGMSLGLKDKQIGRLLCNFTGGFDYYEQWEYLENIHLDLSYSLRDNLKLGFCFDRLWRAPSFTELYYWSPANRGDDTLKVQRSNNFEWGLDYCPDEGLAVNVNLFFRNQSDSIDWVRDASFDPWQARNVGDLDAWGADFFSQFDLQTAILKNLSLGYTYLNLEKDNPHNFSKYVFDYNRHKIVAILGLEFGALSASLIGNFAYPTDRQRYTTFDFRAEKELADFTLILEGINIFAEDYQEMQDIAGCGRWLKISLAYEF